MKNTSYYIVNDKGFFGEYLFNEQCRSNNGLQSTLTDLPEAISNQIYIRHPNYNDLLANLQTLQKLNVVILLDITQEKEIKLLDNYLSKHKLHFRISEINTFLELPYYSSEDLKYKIEKNSAYKLLYVFLKLHNELNLNPSKMLNFPTNEFITFKVSDFKDLNKDKYPKSFKLIETDDFSYFYKVLYSELTGIYDLELEILQRFDDEDCINECLNIENYSKEELQAVQKLMECGDIYKPMLGMIKRV